MTRRWWYLRRGVAWQPVLGCCAAAAMVTLALGRWPAGALVLLPALVACCAAAAAFAFDEPATAVVSVTPRGDSWRRTTRAAVAALPLLVWVAVVLARPGDLVLARPGWLLLGTAVIAATFGAAGIASRRDHPAPGSSLAAAVAIAVVSPLVVVGLLGLESPYPMGTFGGGVLAFWLSLGAGAAVVVAAVLAPAPRRRVARS